MFLLLLKQKLDFVINISKNLGKHVFHFQTGQRHYSCEAFFWASVHSNEEILLLFENDDPSLDTAVLRCRVCYQRGQPRLAYQGAASRKA